MPSVLGSVPRPGRPIRMNRAKQANRIVMVSKLLQTSEEALNQAIKLVTLEGIEATLEMVRVHMEVWQDESIQRILVPQVVIKVRMDPGKD